MENIRKEFVEFCELIEERVKEFNFDFGTFPTDHTCYRAATKEEYEQYRDLFIENSVLYTKKYFHERDFHMFVLKEPLEYKGFKFHYLEFAQPGGSDTYATGFQHIEFLTKKKWEDLVDQNILDKYLFKSKNGEEYIKWEDKSALKLTDTPQVTHALLEDNSEIHLVK